MVTWGQLEGARPDLTGAGEALFYPHGVGLAFLATVRGDGYPRLHPVCPLLVPDGIFAFILPSPKQADLRRDGAYALHSFPRPDDEDAYCITGRARLVTDENRRAELSAQFVGERVQFGVAAPADVDALFEFDIESCLWTRTTGHGDPRPQHTVWRAPPAPT